MYIQIYENFQIIFNYRMIYLIKQSVHFSAVGIATRYGLEGRENFRPRPDCPWCPPSLLYKVYRVLPRGKAAEAWR
jgi:hypothetical protein